MSLHKINPTRTNAWNELLLHQKKIAKTHLKDLFASDDARFKKFSISFNNILLDYSKNRITEETMVLLNKLAIETNLKENINSFLKGDVINETEKRAVMHTALRKQGEEPVFINHEDIMPQVLAAKHKIKQFAENFTNQKLNGYTGKPLNTIINIGIGGSDLGPSMVTEALKYYQVNGISNYFVSNVDATHLVETLKKVNPEQTLFIIASKTFTTQETMANAVSAKQWLIKHFKNEAAVSSHFVALSTNTAKVNEFGILNENMFEFWDWVGGRYSLWSSIGLSIACSIGFENFEKLLAGANAMDEHFKHTPFESNMPVILALLGIWYNNFWDAHTHAILPYNQYLHRFAAYFQQADMESNGKSVDRSGSNINYQSGPIIWGEPGTNGQHAFYQLIHQGTKLIPCDFIAAANSNHQLGVHHQLLLSNFFAQSQALMMGKTKEQVAKEMQDAGCSQKEIEQFSCYRIFEGNKPSNSILIKNLDPYTLGSLIAMYEHKIFVQGAIWNIYSFDQWGVELGKQLANNILPELKLQQQTNNFDSSTNGLVNQYKIWSNN
jgi:glucose-6-phosphate isomerase